MNLILNFVESRIVKRKITRVHSRTFIWISTFFLLTICLNVVNAVADDFGKFDGAVWRFELTPIGKFRGKDAIDATLHGNFRVKKLALFQRDGRDDKEWTKKVGKSEPDKEKRPDHTTLRLNDFKGFEKGEKGEEGKRIGHAGLKGEASLKRNGKGGPGQAEAEGKFIDSDGLTWEMKVWRVRE